ncbi:acyltransferase family protein [Bacillus testis]|uniref:acyltransferase family protein n=1 Tax=Bacillus testis TaxID=1622072 RepID=UPI00067EED8E|nr:acyltransferase family protein [Bacillus testis]
MNTRSFFFDNAKFILIFFVVFGHLLRTYIHDADSIYALYKTIYTFHMPAFILVSGFFAKGIYRKGYIVKLFKKLIVPYLIFQGIYSVYFYYLDKAPTIKLDPFEPHWSLWFLISLFFWNMMLLLFSRMKPLYGLTLTILIGLLVGYVDEISNYLSLSRTFVFFPMFLAGYYLKKEHIQKLFTVKIRVASILIFIIVIVGFYLYPDIDYKWLLGSKPYSELNATFGMLTRLSCYGLSFLMIACFLSLVPRGRYFFTLFGERTLYVYLLHGFFIQFFRESNLHQYVSSSNVYWILVALAMTLTLLLSSRFVFSMAQPVIELNATRFKPHAYRMMNQMKRYIRLN